MSETKAGCIKAPHTGTGYSHAEDDDSPYDVDGVLYCGRCHRFLNACAGWNGQCNHGSDAGVTVIRAPAEEAKVEAARNELAAIRLFLRVPDGESAMHFLRKQAENVAFLEAQVSDLNAACIELKPKRINHKWKYENREGRPYPISTCTVCGLRLDGWPGAHRNPSCTEPAT